MTNFSLKRGVRTFAAVGCAASSLLSGYWTIALLLHGVPPEFAILIPFFGTVSVCSGACAVTLGKNLIAMSQKESV